MIFAVAKSRQANIGTVSMICRCFNVKRNSYYKQVKAQKKGKEVKDAIIRYVKVRRKDQSREGLKKIHKSMVEDEQMQDIQVGRDKLNDILREEDMLVKKKRSYVKTTDSRHHFRKHKNIIKDIEILRPIRYGCQI